MQDDSLQLRESSQLVGSPDTGPAGAASLREMLSIGLIGLGGVLLIVFVLRMLRQGSRARATSAAGQPSRSRPASREQRPSHDRLEETMADAEELTRRLAAILDDKASRLETLITQADERMARLSELHTTSLQRAPIARERATAPVRAEPPPEGPDAFHRQVYELADQGLSPIDIARRIEKPTGQVELILALRRA